LGSGKGIRPVKTEWWGAGMVICLVRCADLHMAQLMPLPLTVSCFSKIQMSFTFLVLAHPGSPGKRAIKRGVCVLRDEDIVYVCVDYYIECCYLCQASLSQHEVTVVQRTSNAVQDNNLIERISQLGFAAFSPLEGCQLATIDIEGMTCISCVRTIETCLSVVEGIKTSHVSLSDNCAQVVFDSISLDIQQICDAISSCGFIAKTRFHSQDGVILPVKSDVSPKPDPFSSFMTGRIRIEGMTCDSCVKNIEDNVGQMNGVVNITVSLPDKMAIVKFNPTVTGISALALSITDMGYEAENGVLLDGLQTTENSADSCETEFAPSSSANKVMMINVNGMTCESCVKSVHSCISSLPGVSAVTVSLANNMAYVTLSGHVTTAADVAATVSDIGFDASVFQPLADASTNIPASASNTEILIGIRGMHCNSCTRAIEGQVGSAIGVHSVVVSLLDETAKIQYNARLISAEQLRQIIQNAGDFEAYICSEIGKWVFHCKW